MGALGAIQTSKIYRMLYGTQFSKEHDGRLLHMNETLISGFVQAQLNLEQTSALLQYGALYCIHPDPPPPPRLRPRLRPKLSIANVRPNRAWHDTSTLPSPKNIRSLNPSLFFSFLQASRVARERQNGPAPNG